MFCIDRAGVVGADGATHNGVLDIAFLRSIPGATILCRSRLRGAALDDDARGLSREARGRSPSAIRAAASGAWRGDTSAAAARPFIQQTAGHEVTLVTHGIVMINETLAAAEKLESRRPCARRSAR